MKYFRSTLIRHNSIIRAFNTISIITGTLSFDKISRGLHPQELLFMNSLQNKLERDYEDEKQTYDES